MKVIPKILLFISLLAFGCESKINITGTNESKLLPGTAEEEPERADSESTVQFIPTMASNELQFWDTDPDSGQIAGDIVIPTFDGESQITHYVLYWGSDAATKLADTAFESFPLTETEGIFRIEENSLVPDGATHILVFAKNDTGESGENSFIEIIDKATPLYAATSIHFSDTDHDASEIGGLVTIIKAEDESDLSHYVLYFGIDAETKKGPAIVEFAKTGADVIYSFADNTPLDGATHFLVYTKNTDGEMTTNINFAIDTNNTNRAPVLDTISDETVAEMVAIAQVDAGDGGDDQDVDNETITYACVYDTTIDANVGAGTACTSLTGLTFATATGVMNWTPNYSQSGTYEFKITGSDGSLSDGELFGITVTNTNRAPVLDAISDETVAENAAITQVDGGDGGDDLDVDNDAITYSCVYDTTIDASVGVGTSCTSLAGLTFATATGVLDWTPNYSQSGTYEFKITGSDGSLSDDELFGITVTNTNRAPLLDAISDETVAENAAITQVNAGDGGDDQDVDNDTVTYACVYDTTIDASVGAGTACTSLTGLTFATATGVLDWTPNYSQSGTYEFKITGSDGSLSDDELFGITVTNTNRAPVLDAISDETVAENAAITQVDAADGGDDFDADSDAITYACVYDATIDASVGAGTACTSLTGVTFATATGVINWTPNYSQSGTYEFKITGSDGSLSDDELFGITVTNTNRAPVLDAISDESVAENAAITQVNAGDGGDDFDADSDAITYACVYDTTIDASVGAGTACTSLSGVTFNTATGVMDWTPDNDQGGTYEFKITGSDGSLSDDELFGITVTNTNRAPVLDAISDETVAENAAITQVDAADGGDDQDVDNDTVTYACVYDTTIDASVGAGTACTSLTGVTFATATGVLDWTPNYSQSGTYEFKITGSDGSLSDDELFGITVTNTNRAPVLDAISNETVAENAAITQVNAGDGGDDFDADSDSITYVCVYDTTIDASVGAGTACTSLSGVTFNTATGVMDWTPNYSQSGTYEIKITGSDGSLSDDELFGITVTNTNRAPVLDAISDETVAENAAISQVDAGDGGDDLDVDNETITYACVYDTTIDASVGAGTACTSLTGLTFATATGVMNWTPNYSQSGTYEFKITGSDGSLSDDELFGITVTNTNRAPVLDAISNETVAENAAITQVNAGDGGDDFDADSDAITYACVYDTTIDASVGAGTACTSLSGVTFNTATGVMDWTPDNDQGGTYEFKITGSDGSLSDDELFGITVTNTNRAPVLDAISDEIVAENAAITQVDAADGGDDLDVDNDTITYACVYDTTIDASVGVGTACTSLAGLTFATATGVFDWTPNYSQSGTYEFKITGSDGSLSDDELFGITITNTNRAPVLDAISDETVAENAAITQVDAADGGDDQDVDNDTVTYACVYDTTIDASVGAGTACTSLTGLTFATATGVLDWTPNYSQSGTYEFKITGSDGSLSDDELFGITVTNTNRAPVLDAISNETVAENAAITQVNAGDGGDDFDADSDAITYACVYDTTIDASVGAGTDCTSLSGVTFNTVTGVMDWTPDNDQGGTYEFKITGSDGSLSDNELFGITVTNTNRAPVLDAISDEIVAENAAITQVDAADGGDDQDVDNDTVTYACVYDTTIDASVGAGTACTSLTGLTFATATGVLDWTPNYSQSGTYEFKITGSDGSLSDDELFGITVTNTNRAPVLDAISNETVAENAAITQVNAGDGGDDFDADSDAITYACVYDTTIDASVGAGTACTSLTGLTFATATGVLDWTPNYSQSGTYEFKITGSDGSLSDDELFGITVTNTNRAPVLDAISNETVAENAAITQVNAGDGGDDFDADSDAITYACVYDTTIDASVGAGTDCTSLSGVTFNTATGVMDWTPDNDQGGTYEFKITGSDGSLSDDELFGITVTNTNRAPVLDAISDEIVAENAAITQVDAADGGDDQDVDNDTVTYACVYDTTIDASVGAGTACTSLTGLTFATATGVLDWTPNYSQSGTYEFKITGSDGSLSDDELFGITVTNTNRAPVLDAISNETVAENAAITQVNAGDGGDDFDADSDAITYACVYDTTIDASVGAGTACTSLTGLTFATATGVLDWTPNYSQSGTYEFKITGSDGSLSDDELFGITVTNTNRAPVLDAISDETVAENVAITQVNAGDGGDDLDVDNDTITYTCRYDLTIDGNVDFAITCSGFTGLTFNTATGVMDWTPNYNQSGTYEFVIIGSDGSLVDSEIFGITVTNTNRAPVLDAISDESIAENAAITQVNAGDGGDDFDADSDAITYACVYDTTIDASVGAGTACPSLSGVTFNTATGVMDWTPNYSQSGTYEFKITGSDGSLSDDELFGITVTNTNRAPVLDAISDETVAENAAITQVNAGDGGDDFDADSDAITYACVYDTTIDSNVGTGTACTSLVGLSFNTGTGVMDWTPTSSGSFEFKISGTDGSLSDDEIFSITVEGPKNCVWEGTTSTDWFDATNWSGCGAGLPGPNDTVRFPNSAPNSPNLNASTTVGDIAAGAGGKPINLVGTNVDLTIGNTISSDFYLYGGGCTNCRVLAPEPVVTVANGATLDLWNSFTFELSKLDVYGRLRIANYVYLNIPEGMEFFAGSQVDIYSVYIINVNTNAPAIKLSENMTITAFDYVNIDYNGAPTLNMIEVDDCTNLDLQDLHWVSHIYSDAPSGGSNISVSGPGCSGLAKVSLGNGGGIGYGNTYENDPNNIINWDNNCEWTGAISTDWHDAGNWINCDSWVPHAGSKILVPSAPPNQPLLSASGNFSGTYAGSGGGILTIGAGADLGSAGLPINSYSDITLRGASSNCTTCNVSACIFSQVGATLTLDKGVYLSCYAIANGGTLKTTGGATSSEWPRFNYLALYSGSLDIQGAQITNYNGTGLYLGSGDVFNFDDILIDQVSPGGGSMILIQDCAATTFTDTTWTNIQFLDSLTSEVNISAQGNCPSAPSISIQATGAGAGATWEDDINNILDWP